MEDDEDVYDVNLIGTLVQEHVDELLDKDSLKVALTFEEANLLESPEVEYLYSLLNDNEVYGVYGVTGYS